MIPFLTSDGAPTTTGTDVSAKAETVHSDADAFSAVMRETDVANEVTLQIMATVVADEVDPLAESETVDGAVVVDADDIPMSAAVDVPTSAAPLVNRNETVNPSLPRAMSPNAESVAREPVLAENAQRTKAAPNGDQPSVVTKAPSPSSAQRIIEDQIRGLPQTVTSAPNQHTARGRDPVINTGGGESPPVALTPATNPKSATATPATMKEMLNQRVEQASEKSERKKQNVAAPVVGGQAQTSPPAIPQFVSAAQTSSIALHKAAVVGALEKQEARVAVQESELSVGPTTQEKTLQTISNVSPSAPAAAAQTAKYAAQQIAAAISQSTGKSTEIALNPEELGRVRLNLSATDATVTLTVFAERPETQDLLRRHIDVLEQEFRALGYETISFSFDADQQSDAQQTPDMTEGENQLEMHEDAQPIIVASGRPTTGLDLRL